jgi:hypothetical protein
MVYLKEMVNSRQRCAKFRIRWKGPYEVIGRLSDLKYLVKLSRTKEIVVNVNKIKKVFSTDRFTTDDQATEYAQKNRGQT